ncbi:hypothetical protein [Streptomyces hydrogenans]|uniref:hypothetical protein n=1 Tax=Streptomyces hydrogenans TaxID=1873719 RepID=UPI00380B8828
MTGYLRCPAPNCTHTVTRVARPAASTAMAKHLVDAHGLPEVSASYQADLLLPIVPKPQAA